jgi:ABC-2 type transport system ATP-binding protein
MDETLDGLDPVMRGFVKRLLYQEVMDSDATVIISSHSLRELEDACDNLAMIHSGKIIFQRDIQNISSTVSKVQVVLEEDIKRQEFDEIDVLNYTKKGSVANLIVRGGCEKVLEVLEKKNPLLLEVLPLSLEEVFTYELKQKGYSFDEIFINGGDDNEE